MRIAGFVWLADLFDCRDSDSLIAQNEVEEVVLGWPAYRRIEEGRHPGEHVYAAMGQTERGRHLVVFFLARAGGVGLIVGARDMTEAERKRYAGE